MLFQLRLFWATASFFKIFANAKSNTTYKKTLRHFRWFAGSGCYYGGRFSYYGSTRHESVWPSHQSRVLGGWFFFFLLSGFVISYAYDDRWSKMSVGDFFKIRLIRLQPMVIMGMIVGALCFYFQDSVLWPNIHDVPLWKMLLIMVIALLWFLCQLTLFTSF